MDGAIVAMLCVAFAGIGFVGGVIYSERTRKSAQRIEEKYHSVPASEMFKDGNGG